MNGCNNIFTLNPINFLGLMTVNNINWFRPGQMSPVERQSIALTNRLKMGAFDLQPMGGVTVKFRISSGLPANDQPINAYWCPYEAGGGLPGFVDFPRNGPLYPFVFTAAMNGCAFVVTTSPAGGGSLRLYHHQHPGDANAAPGGTPQRIWNAINNQGQAILSVFMFEDYGAATPAHTEPNAFNFLYHDGHHWYYVSQPQTANMGTSLCARIPGAVIRQLVLP
jgi:hypothetical protein